MSKRVKNWPVEIYDSTYGKITLEDNALITPMALQCGTKVTYGYGTHHYEAKAGKLVGVWPYDFTEANLKELRTKWGYTGIFCQNKNQYNLATSLNVGYKSDSVMLSIAYSWYNPLEYLTLLDSCNAKYYYIDEAVNHACMGNAGKRLYQDWEIAEINNNVSSKRPGSYLVNSGYKRCPHLDYLVAYSNIIMYSAYSEWVNPAVNYWNCYTNMTWSPSIEKLWVEGDPVDQRASWSDMRNKYGSKFSMTWINTKELSEFLDLFGHAKNLGLNSVWIYGFVECDENGNNCIPVPHHNDQWDNISNAAFYNGYLRRFVQDYRIEWRCDSLNPCQDCDPTDPEGWYIYQITPIKGTVHELIW